MRYNIQLIDEIQVSEKAYNSIRRLYAEIECDIIVTGSYLGQTIKSDYFLPSGTISYLHMYPLSFAEFCRVYNKEKLLETIDIFGSGDVKDYRALHGLYTIYRKIV